MKGATTSSTGLEDAFIKVSFEDDKTAKVAREGDSEVFSEWVDKGEQYTSLSNHALLTDHNVASATYSNAKLIGSVGRPNIIHFTYN